ncbi:hypothetical protein L486_07227 [Kwoniella mangroviensis CBS 10435]|uniref:Uncharacterized protein n=1 Tax=Kwoniella mangroviensis CBS 10435 TaxID=1331196 RepID=A0A1B9IHL9_9TREE|nr:hypothetical protein L486_07227 [Kwoniella mangroviensis CBS 10435]
MSNPVDSEHRPHTNWLEVLSRALASAPDPNTTYPAERRKFPPTKWCDPTIYRRTVYRDGTADQARLSGISQEEFLNVRQGLKIPGYQRIKLDDDGSESEISYIIQERSLITPISSLPPEHGPSNLDRAEGMVRMDSEYSWDGHFALHTLKPNQCQQLDCLGWTEKDIEDPTSEHDSSKTKGILVTDGMFGSGWAMPWKCNRIKTPSRFTNNDLINNANHYDHSGLDDLSQELNSYDFRSTLYIYRPLRKPDLPVKPLTNKYNDRIHTWLAHDQSSGYGQPIDVNTKVSSCGSRLESSPDDQEDDDMTIKSDHTVTLSTIEENRRAEHDKRQSKYNKRFSRDQDEEMSEFSSSQTPSYSSSSYFDQTDENNGAI